MLCSVAQWILLSLGTFALCFTLVRCSAHRQHGEAHRTLQLDALKASILGYLGMDRPPALRARESRQELDRMFEQYRQMQQLFRGNSTQEETLTQHTHRVSTTILPVSVVPVSEQKGEHHMDPKTAWYRADFHRMSSIRNETLVQARLKLHNAVPGCSHNKQKILIKIHEYEEGKTHLHHMEKSVTKRRFCTRNVTLDIRAAIEKWRVRSRNSTLTIDIGFTMGSRTDQTIPKIVLEMDFILHGGKGKPRQVRSMKEEDCEEENKCCRISLNVSFKDIGWSDWVVAPSSYKMYFCDGSCPHNYKPASMHTLVKSRMHHMSKGATPRPCCVPAAYEPMILMHYDSRGKLKLTPFNDLIVSKCHCA
ncbi:hypothetical protein AALO_G00002560 [Alosa alosa]|uniref:TGF-beta family profile domain-containing protein n=1 Tax=Alosa alosa TaxID=278164 RepID=A0AAV6HDB3_9TELE|nr:inhibin beta C chain [Alosa alosa]KAG5285364.1 hypothetical protein AALO_G00002560 [Alosa alosa]